ncbi:helix-turn-helix transcriptional regulator [Epilithonimonas sp.]|uniref:helix-turn-helix domain-containing protein n=1 Tax=Epilithonimonas sp. TaxID=2894511 RepID=UPI00289C4261|nr:helix-turn-helix transcriptional regulator [Epilithonimonas sp.]
MNFILKSNLCFMQETDSIILKKIGDKVREIRLQKKLTQKELAFDLDIEISQITRIETGKINTSILNLFKIAKALEVDIKELFNF